MSFEKLFQEISEVNRKSHVAAHAKVLTAVRRFLPLWRAVQEANELIGNLQSISERYFFLLVRQASFEMQQAEGGAGGKLLNSTEAVSARLLVRLANDIFCFSLLVGQALRAATVPRTAKDPAGTPARPQEHVLPRLL